MLRTYPINGITRRRLCKPPSRKPSYGLALSLTGLLFLVLPSSALGQQTVPITSPDGFRLSAKHYASVQPGPGILLLHQCNRRGPLTGYEALAEALRDAGFHILMLDARGFGDSRDDQYRDFHAQMALIEPKIHDDAEAAYQFLVTQPQVTASTMGIVGASCGMRQAVQLGQNHDAVRTFVFLSGAYETQEALRTNYAPLTERPTLAIYSEDDRYDTPAMMNAVFDQSKHPATKLLAYKGNAHGTPLFNHDPTLVSALVQWFTTHLSRD